MANLSDKKALGHPPAQQVEIVRVEYDFSKDGGAQGDFVVYEAKDDVSVRCRGIHVETALTSGGSATVSLGVGAAGTDYQSAAAIAGFSAGAVVASASEAGFKVAAAGTINMTVGTADLTAGKMVIVLEIDQF